MNDILRLRPLARIIFAAAGLAAFPGYCALGADDTAQGAGGAFEQGKAIVAGSAAVAMQWIAAGTFDLGTAKGGKADERPVTTVHITRGFWLGRIPVTQGQWQAVMGTNPSRFKDQGADAPVEAV